MGLFTVEVLMALEEGDELTADWWAERWLKAVIRAGEMPSEVADPSLVGVEWETDAESGYDFVRATWPLPETTTLGRARELSHMLTSVFDAEGYTMREDGERVERLPGTAPDQPAGSLGELAYTEARVCSPRCMACIMTTETRIGCCSQGAAFSLADIGASLLAGEDRLVAEVLALPGARDGVKYHPHLAGGKCVYHDPNRGCTLPAARMPLQCRTYLCLPEQLLPRDVAAAYGDYVAGLEEAEEFISQHMREHGGVDFHSPLPELKEAAARAFAAWEAHGASGRS